MVFLKELFEKLISKKNLQLTETYKTTQHAKISIIAKQKGEEKVWILSHTVTD